MQWQCSETNPWPIFGFHFSQASEEIIPYESEIYRPPVELYSYVTAIEGIHEGELWQTTPWLWNQLNLTCCLNTLTLLSSCLEHGWGYHSEHSQQTEFEQPQGNHLTELQSVPSQQLLPPYRYGDPEPLTLPLDPGLGGLAISPQVSLAHKSFKSQFINGLHTLTEVVCLLWQPLCIKMFRDVAYWKKDVHSYLQTEDCSTSAFLWRHMWPRLLG